MRARTLAVTFLASIGFFALGFPPSAQAAQFTYTPFDFGPDVNHNDWNFWAMSGVNIWNWSHEYREGLLHYSFSLYLYPGSSCIESCLMHAVWNLNPTTGFDSANVIHRTNIFAGYTLQTMREYRVDVQWHKSSYYVSAVDVETGQNVVDQTMTVTPDAHTYDAFMPNTVWQSNGAYIPETPEQHAALFAQWFFVPAPEVTGGGYDIRTTALPVFEPASTTQPSNVLFLPGLQGSRLYDTEGGETQLWLSNDETVKQLAMTDSGTSVRSDIYTRDIIKTEGAGTYVVYQRFADTMDELKDDGVINDWEAIPYDWRLPPSQIISSGKKDANGNISYLQATSTPYIVQELKKLAATSKSGKVTIVAHSYGGLVTKQLLISLGEDASRYVDKLIFVAVPQIGTPRTVEGILHAKTERISGVVSSATLRSLALNMPSAHALLPSTNYFTYVDDPVITFDPATMQDWITKYGTERIHSTDRLQAFMTDATRPVPAFEDILNPAVLKPQFFSNATTLHNELDAWTPQSGIQLIAIAGWGHDTFSGIRYKKIDKISCAAVNALGLCSKKGPKVQILTFDPIVVVDGDDTVTVPSALWSNDGLTLRYWVNTGQRKLADHARIFGVPELNEVIANTVKNYNNFQLPPIISTTTPTGDSNHRLHFILHSPLTLGFLDSNGAYTGSTATTTLFDVPESQFEQYGEVQWLSIPADATGKVVMQGVGSGSFSLDIEEQVGNEVISTASFEGIVNSTSTKAYIDISPAKSATASSTLVVDFNGDGQPETSLAAKQGAIVTPDIAAPTSTLSVFGIKGLNDWYTSNVNVLLTATDTESGVQATYLSIDGAPAVATTTGTLKVEGIHTLSYYSLDRDGNQEDARTAIVKIDKTPPEIEISLNLTTRDLNFIGKDNLSAVTLANGATSTKATDSAGNTTLLSYKKVYASSVIANIQLTSVSYANAPAINLGSLLTYTWTSTPSIPAVQTAVVNSTTNVVATYDKGKNKTSITVAIPGKVAQYFTASGLSVLKLTTNKGKTEYAW